MALSLPYVALRDVTRNGVRIFEYGDLVSAQAVTANSLVVNTDVIAVGSYQGPGNNPFYKTPVDPYPMLSDETSRALAAEAAPVLPHYTTLLRPSAVTAGVGATYFDTTLNLPGFSTGAIWVNAAGATI